MRERALIADLLAPLATHRAARGLTDDAAVWLPPLGREVVLTHDVIACGTHYLPDDPPSDVAWKLLAVNLSDLAAMGAEPVGVLLGLTLGGHEDDDWLRGFVAGLGRALTHFEVALLGGDTVRWGGAAVLGCTAVGQVPHGCALGRDGVRVGDAVWVSGTIGDAGRGLAVARGEAPHDKRLLDRYRRPNPRLALGRALVGTATACMDVSDGVLIDAQRLAAASGVGIELDLAALPVTGDCDEAERLIRATAGDDYELLFTAAPDAELAALATAKVPLTRIGRVVAEPGLTVLGAHGLITPARLGWEH
ncbi:thiamine-phosphate kinase [Glacieibacterium frigidum]|uniref:Thiamine-monophosphate kinase n=1 Tax=Glacieibacterium frigidum TaxID=2593303 RepID=A0A552UFM9_9SPHN|nr:thiamine-phosphate kinase [Glacieibacterium frigidum]TRW16991.1 thiamine-phosphate kinase [Glacieibacterium frigidum]